MLTFEVVTKTLSYFCLLTLMWSMISLPSPLWNRNKGQEVGGKQQQNDWGLTHGWSFQRSCGLCWVIFSKIRDMLSLTVERDTEPFFVCSFGLWRLDVPHLSVCYEPLLSNPRIHWFWEGHSKRDSVAGLDSHFVTCALQCSRSSGTWSICWP